jgi:hypothetical protein
MTKIVVTCEDFDAKLEGTEPRALPPFPELLLDPSAIWP